MDPVTQATTISVRSLKRVALLLLGIGLFVGVASVIKPPPQLASATPIQLKTSTASRAMTTEAHWKRIINTPHSQGWRLIGQLEGAEYRVLCFGSPDGPRFSVYSLDAKPLQLDLPADEVYRGFPGLDIEHLRLEPGESGPLMLIDTERP